MTDPLQSIVKNEYDLYYIEARHCTTIMPNLLRTGKCNISKCLVKQLLKGGTAQPYTSMALAAMSHMALISSTDPA